MKVKKSKKQGVMAILLTIVVTASMLLTENLHKEVRATELTPVQVHGQLHVSSTQIVDQNGNAFQLRGISTHGINWDIGKPYVNQAAFQTLRDDWGANAVRLAMYTAEYNGYCSGGNQSELMNTLHNGVEYAKNLGMYAVIDWHVLNDQNPNQYVEQAKGFFQEVSAQYKDYNNILYEICNEPNNCSWDEIKAYANTIIPIIRSNDPDAVIIVGTPTWSQLGQWGHTNEVADSPLTGYTDIVYALHFYCAESSHTQYLPAKVDYAVSKGIPILVSEFGLSAADGNGAIDTAQGQAWLNKLDGYKIGYFCWSLSNKAESSALINAGCGKISDWNDGDLSDAGRFIKNQYQIRRENYLQADSDKVDAFVTRLYNKALNREPDESGKQHWKSVLMDGSRSGASVGYGFVFSTEYKAKNTSNEEYVEMLYNVFLDRTSDTGGKTHWVDLLEQGISREYVFRGFAQSQEYTNICNSYGIVRGNVALTQPRDQRPNLTRYINRLYVKALGRDGEADGMNHWCNVILTGTKTPEEVAERFINSEEFKNKNLTDEEYVKALYRTFMGREYDQAGLEHWLSELKKGCSRENILHRFANSAEFKLIMADFGL